MKPEVPEGFLWGAATSSHQVEGGNVANDWWREEHTPRPEGVPGPPPAEPSGDACDSYHRYGEDVDLLAGFGLNAYRFSLEWSRIEPERGFFSRAAVDHYRRMVEACHARGVTPVVTVHHFTLPRWFADAGAWSAPDAAEVFARFCEHALPVLREGVEWAVTINEPNIHSSVLAMRAGEPMPGFLPPPRPADVEGLTAAHGAARKVLADVPGLRTGWSIAAFGMVAADGQDAVAVARAAQLHQDYEEQFVQTARGDDFVGVQAYTRTLVGPEGVLPPKFDDPLTTQTMFEYYPAALGESVRRFAATTGGPVLVTENGIATADDAQRIAYTRDALKGLSAAMDDGVDVRGYLHWSLLDNYEWGHGYEPTFGLVAVDRTTFARTPKPSAAWLGRVAGGADLDSDRP